MCRSHLVQKSTSWTPTMRHTLLCPHGCEVNPSHLVQKSTIVSICLPVIYRYDHFKLDLDHNQARYITSFYTADGGYNLCLLIFLNGLKWDGWMSVTAIILPGVHDRSS